MQENIKVSKTDKKRNKQLKKKKKFTKKCCISCISLGQMS